MGQAGRLRSGMVSVRPGKVRLGRRGEGVHWIGQDALGQAWQGGMPWKMVWGMERRERSGRRGKVVWAQERLVRSVMDWQAW